MSEKAIQRGIQSVASPAIQTISPGHSNRLLVEGDWKAHDPFLFLAEDWFEKGSFGLHPHRGMETVTYVMEGKLEHYDNKGGRDELNPGDAQWMTAGRGVIHLEDPAEGERVHSLQLWVNLPAAAKMTEPRYQNLRSSSIAVRKEAGVTAKIFSGCSAGVTADTLNYTPVTMVEFNVEPGRTAVQDLPGAYQGFVFVLEGEGLFGSDAVPGQAGQILWLTPAAGYEASEVSIQAVTKLRCLLYAGQPLGEPVVARGPFVMNTAEQIQQAYQDYRDGKFA